MADKVGFKITDGYVRQDYVNGKCVGQRFFSSADCEWEDEVGNPIDAQLHSYHPYDMVSPQIWEVLMDYGLLREHRTDSEFEAKVTAFLEKLG